MGQWTNLTFQFFFFNPSVPMHFGPWEISVCGLTSSWYPLLNCILQKYYAFLLTGLTRCETPQIHNSYLREIQKNRCRCGCYTDLITLKFKATVSYYSGVAKQNICSVGCPKYRQAIGIATSLHSIRQVYQGIFPFEKNVDLFYHSKGV